MTALVQQRLDEARVELGAIIDYATSFGNVTISRAYANWAAPVNATYAKDLQQRAIDLVQLFPMTGTKNGADIRLVVDAVEAQKIYPHVSHVLVVAGDSDYVALAQQAKRTGQKVIGVGAGDSDHRYWRLACDEFRDYKDLPGVAAEAPDDLEPTAAPQRRPEWLDLLRRAMLLTRAKTDGDWVAAATVKTQMQRLDPTFNERAAGHQSFGGFLEAASELVEVQNTDHGHTVRLLDEYSTPVAASLEADLGFQPFLSDTVAQMRARLAIASTGEFGEAGERQVVFALRCLWEIVRSAGVVKKLPGEKLIETLVARRVPQQEARRLKHIVATTVIPALVRNTEMDMSPNPELVELDDDALLRFVRQWAVDRVRNLQWPEQLDLELVTNALNGTSVSPDARSAYASVTQWGCFKQMSGALETQLLPAPVLWDVADAVCQVPAEVPVRSVEDFSAAVSAPLVGIDRDPGQVAMPAAYLALSGAGVLAGADGALFNQRYGSEPDEVVDAVVTSWAKGLSAAGLLDPAELVSRESFYRLTLPDRFQAAERLWIRNLILPLADT